jgi:hypothetical protein
LHEEQISAAGGSGAVDSLIAGQALSLRSGAIPALLDRLGVGGGLGTAHLPTSTGCFPDGARFRVEIPSVEGPRCVAEVLRQADQLNVPVRRLSQGSGVTLLTDAELDDMASATAGAGVELSLFARPCAAWGVSASASSAAGPAFGSTARGPEQLAAVIEEIFRAASHGVRSVLVSDLGVL